MPPSAEPSLLHFLVNVRGLPRFGGIQNLPACFSASPAVPCPHQSSSSLGQRGDLTLQSHGFWGASLRIPPHVWPAPGRGEATPTGRGSPPRVLVLAVLADPGQVRSHRPGPCVSPAIIRDKDAPAAPTSETEDETSPAVCDCGVRALCAPSRGSVPQWGMLTGDDVQQAGKKNMEPKQPETPSPGGKPPT